MRRWFERLPIHGKLVTSALLITAVALLVAMLGLSALDVWRYRTTAAEDAGTMARVLAENTAAAVMFNESGAAEETLQSIRVRDVVTRACIFLPDGSLFVEYTRAMPGCPGRHGAVQWRGVSGSSPIMRNGRSHGIVYVERNLSDLRGRLLLTAFAGLLMFAVAASAAYVLAQRVNAAISRPISTLARYARSFASNPAAAPPVIRTTPDELGDLVTSFGDMVTQVRRANDELLRSNEALRREHAGREAALAREQEANRLKDEFLAAVSHELRTPLNAMMGWAQVLGSARPDEATIKTAVERIVRNARVQTRVIEDLIDVSRIVTGKLKLSFERLDVRVVIAAAVESMEAVAAANGVRIECEAPGNGCFVSGDRDRLQQVLWNLLSNGVKFTPRGGTVSVRLSCGNRLVQVMVRDTGIGILPPFLPHVFDRFRQADGSTTREHGGLGLGLAIVKELTELHGGSVTAASPGRDQGATFMLSLPEAGPELATGQSSGAAASDAPLPSLAGVRVVAVDDNDDAAAIISAALAGAGAEVDTFTSPEDALAAWERRPADVLICDLAMPRMSGVELLGRVRRLDSIRGVYTPALAVSAHASEQHRADSLSRGFEAHLAKPLQQTTLIRAVADVLANT